MKIEIVAGGIYGAEGEIPIGTVMDVKSEPQGWAGRYRVVSGGGKDKVAVTNPAKAGLKAVHHGGGRFNVVDGDQVMMSAEDKAAFVEAETAKG
jgi:hypothetical protein